MSPFLTVLLGTSLLGCVAGVVGCFTVLRRRALMGDLVAHAALPGICLAFLLTGTRSLGWLILGASVAGLVAVLLVNFIAASSRTKPDAALAIVLGTFFGAGIALLSYIGRIETGNKAGLETYLFGQAANITRNDLWAITGVSIFGLLAVAAFYKEFKLFSFDPQFASTQGWPCVTLDIAMMALVALVVVVGLPAVGVVLMAAMLIIPPAAARFWTDRLGIMLIVAGMLGAIAAALGTWFSDTGYRDFLPFDPLAFGDRSKGLPTGPLIVLAGTGLLLISVVAAPQRGILARLSAQASLRRRMADEHLLREIYELLEPRLPHDREVPRQQVVQSLGWSHFAATRHLARAARRGWIANDDTMLHVTAAGLEQARQLTRRHRLWELYLIHGVNIAPDHVDRDADDIEHHLSHELIAKLESELSPLTKPAVVEVPSSPHRLGPVAIPPGAATKEGP